MRLASTVILARSGKRGTPEVLVLRRSGRSAFAPDAYVFPGGTVDPDDYERPLAWSDERVGREFRATDPAELPASESAITHTQARALVNAAVRELNEEASVVIPADDLHLFSHWITPSTEPRRYNTHFFIARAGRTHVGTADRIETHDERWIEPAQALALHRDGELHLVYPTIKHLERLAEFADVERLMAFARSKPIVTIMPNGTPNDGFVMPASLEGVW